MQRSTRKFLAATGLATAFAFGAAAPALAHDCINVSAKTENASVGTYDVATDTFTESGDPGNKPFVTIDATGVGGGIYLLYVHPAGPHGVLPSVIHNAICRTHGVTSLEVCFGP